jgi:hypothetical protein
VPDVYAACERFEQQVLIRAGPWGCTMHQLHSGSLQSRYLGS